MKRFAMLCAALAVAACGTRDDRTVADTAGGAMSGDTTMGASAGARTGATAGTASDTGAARMSGATGTSGTGTGGTAAAGAQNQTQSGVTNTKTGQSTLGPGVKRTEPTQGAAVTRDGQTLKPGGDSVKARPPR
jgi:hypothetical protein